MNAKYKPFVKKLVTAVCVLAVLWSITCVALYRVMLRPPESFARVMSKIPGPVAFLLFPFESLWMRARAGRLSIGDHAPDFTLTKLDKTAQVQLSSFTAQGKPVVLVFGSYT